MAPTLVTLGSGSPRGSTTAKGNPRGPQLGLFVIAEPGQEQDHAPGAPGADLVEPRPARPTFRKRRERHGEAGGGGSGYRSSDDLHGPRALELRKYQVDQRGRPGARGGPRFVLALEEQGLDVLRAWDADTSAPPLSTFETVEVLTPAAVAI